MEVFYVEMALMISFVFLFPVSSFSEEASLWIGGFNLELGLKKKEVVEKLNSKYRFVEQEDRLMLMEQKGEKVKEVGVLYFTKGKLSYVSKGWEEYEGFQMETLG